MQIDRLERRQLFSQLVVTGTSSADDVGLSVAGLVAGGLDVRVANLGTHPLGVKVNDSAITLAAGATIRTQQILVGGVTLVQLVDLGPGNDRLTVDPAVNVRVAANGGSGDDTITGGSNDDRLDGGVGNDSLLGGTGRDTIYGGTGSDNIDGGTGNDQLLGNGDGTAALATDRDTIFGNIGDDQLTGDDRAGGLLDGGDGNDTAIATGNTDQLQGDAGNDSLIGSDKTDIIIGGDGNDTIAGRGGDDHLEGDAGNDSINGGDGRDFIEGDDGNDTLFGDLGDDYLLGGIGDDQLQGSLSTGNEISTSGDTLVGGDGNDILREPTTFADYMGGGAGNDLLVATTAHGSAFDGGPGSDTMTGGLGVDIYYLNDSTTADTDSISEPAGSKPNDIELSGGSFQDSTYFVGTFSGPAVIGAVTVSATIDLTSDANLARFGSVHVIGTSGTAATFGTAVGGMGADTINGNSRDNFLRGGGFDLYNIHVSGEGDQAPDLIMGNGGNDTLQAGGSDPLTGTGPIDTLQGGAGDDLLEFADKSADISGGPGYDTEQVGGPGGYHFDTYVMPSDVEALHGGPEAEMALGVFGELDGNALNNDIRGIAAATINGEGGNDTIYGPADDFVGPDSYVTGAVLEGGPGNDYLYDVGKPTDSLRGGPGRDSIYGDNAGVTVDYSDLPGPVKVTLGDGQINDGPAGDPDVLGGNVRNVIGSAGNDTLVGDSHDNVLTGGPGNDQFTGGGGADSVSYADHTVGVNVTLNGLADSGAPGEKDLIHSDIGGVIGTPFADSLTGSAAPDVLQGGDGNDTINGLGGNDSLYGGNRQDPFPLNDGNDELHGGDGDDSLDGGAGNNVLFGDAGNDFLASTNIEGLVTTLNGGDGDDQLVMASNSSTVANGNAGNDIFVNQNGRPDTLDGGDGIDGYQDDDFDPSTPATNDDTTSNVELDYDVIGSNGFAFAATPAVSLAASADFAMKPDVVISGVGVTLSAGVLRVQGSANADTIELNEVGTTVNVVINGKAAAAFAASAIGKINIDAAAGDDIVRLSNVSGANPLKLSARVHGGDGADTILGGAGGDILAGEGGNDSIRGGAGSDVLSGDFVILQGEAIPAAATVPDGSDTIDGGGGSDLVSYTNRTGAMTINLATGLAVSGKEKDKLARVEFVVGGQGNDALTGSAVNEDLFGGAGNDTLTGGAGLDVFSAGVGADSINPDSGNDYINTGPDNLVDRINATLSADGHVATGPTGSLLFGAFNSQDFFSRSGRYFGTK